MSYHTSGSASSSVPNIAPSSSPSNGTRTSNNITSSSSDPSSGIGKVNIRPFNTGSVTEASVTGSQYAYEVTLQFSTKTNFNYWHTDLDKDEALLPVAEPTSEDGNAGGIPQYDTDQEKKTYGIETKTVKWTIGSNKAFSYGYHLDGSPYVHDNSTVDGGGLYLVSVTDGDDNPLEKSERNAWYEEVATSGTAINPDNGKIPSAHKGQLSRGSQETDIKFYADDNGDGTYDHRVEIDLKPWQGINDYMYSSIPAGRGFEDDSYTAERDNNAILFASPIAPAGNETTESNNKYGNGVYFHGYVYPNYYDGRGQVCDFISGNQNQFPRDKVTNDNVNDAADKDKGWLEGYRDVPRRDDYVSPNDDQGQGAPWLTEGQWLTVEEVGEDYYGIGKNNRTGYNYLGVKNGTRGNRTGVKSGTLPFTVSRDVALANSGLIKDRDGIERWSGIWTPEAKDSDDNPYQLKAHDLVVSQISHWDHRGVENFRDYCKQRYELYTILLDVLGVDVDDVADTPADFSWYAVANVGQNGFAPFPDTLLPANPLDFNAHIDDSSSLIELDADSSFGGEPILTFRDYERAYLNKYNKSNNNKNLIDSITAWGNFLDQSNRQPFIDMTACLSVVPPLEELPADIDDDGEVTGADITQILTWWGPVLPDVPASVAADINGDGFVNAQDLTLILAAWGQTGVPTVDYDKTFRPPLNWDPTDRKSAPYITEVDDVEDYTIDGPGVNPVGSDLDEITPGQIGYPDKSMDGYPAADNEDPYKGMSWEIYTGDVSGRRYSANEYPDGLNMTLTDFWWPELKLPTENDLIGNGSSSSVGSGGYVTDDNRQYPCAARYLKMLSKVSAPYLRLGTAMVWQYAGTPDNRTQGNRGGFDIATSTYGSGEGSYQEILSFFAFDRNLDPENLNRSKRLNDDGTTTYNISPSLSWLRYHYGSDWDKRPDPENPNMLVDKRGGGVGPEFSLRRIIRRALSQRGIDYYGGQRSGGKLISSQAGHTDWFDYVPLIGLSCTQYPDWVEMLDKGEVGNTRNGTMKNAAHQIRKDDPDYTYDEMNNSGTLPRGVAGLGPIGIENVTNKFGSATVDNGLGSYTHGSLRFKDLAVKSVDDYTIIPYTLTDEPANEYRGETVQPQDLPDVFPNQLLTVYPSVGGQCGNDIDSLYFRLKEIVEKDLADPNLGDDLRGTADEYKRNLNWRGRYTKDIGDHKEGEQITSWVGTDTPNAPYGTPFPEPDQPVNRLQSGVDPEWVADVDKPYSFLSEVPSENLIRYDDQYFNVIRLDEDGNEVTNGNYYRPHKDIWRPIVEDYRSMDRPYYDQNGRKQCDDSYGNQYLNEVLDGSTIDDTKYAPLNGLYPRNYNPQSPGEAKHWGLKDNQDAMNANYHVGLYIKNTTEGSEGFGKISLVIATGIEHVRNSECCKAEGGEAELVDVSTKDSQKGTGIEGMREVITGSNGRKGFGPTNRAMRLLILDDIGLTDENGDMIENAKVDIGPNLLTDFDDENNPMPGINTYAIQGGMSNTYSFGGIKAYTYVWDRGTFMFGMTGRMFAGIKDEDKQTGTIVKHKPLSDIMNSMPEYYARVYVKYPTFWNNCVGRARVEEYGNTSHKIYSGGSNRGVLWSDGRRDKNLQDWPTPSNEEDSFYGGQQWNELVRALFNQELVQRITNVDTDGPMVAAKWRDDTNGRKLLSTIKEKLYRWKNEPDVMGVLDTDFTGKDIIPIADLPANITALAKSAQTKPFVWRPINLTFDSPDGQQVTMIKNNNSGADGGDHTIGSDASGGPNWVTHDRLFNNNGTEKTSEGNKAGIAQEYTVLGRNKSANGNTDLDEIVGRPIANGGVTDSSGDLPDTTPENRPVAATDEQYDSYLNNDGIRIESFSGKGVLPYKQFVKGKSLYVWLHGSSKWQELVLVSEEVDISSNKIKSHGPRSGATKDTANDYSESGFADDPIKWTQVWVLPNYTDEGTALGVWANMSDTFGDGGTDMMSFFYADPQ